MPSPAAYEVVGLGVGSSIDMLIAQALEFRPKVVAVADSRRPRRWSPRRCRSPRSSTISPHSSSRPTWSSTASSASPASTSPSATLPPGKRLALANKESLIAAGPVVQPLRATPGAELVPVDSEHCAVHQCLRSSTDAGREVSRIVLTASGGPFRGRPPHSPTSVSVDAALAHPTWTMGPKITIDSSTLMNKGLEVIEAHELFGTPYDRIEVVVHPQSIVHSMVEFTDGSTIAQLSLPDMRLPIGYALATRTHRHPVRSHRLGRARAGSTSSRPTRRRSAASPLAYEAGRIGGSAPAWLSAANEVAVDAFLAGRIRWTQIADVCVAVLGQHDDHVPRTIDDVVAADQAARRAADRVIEEIAT